MLTWLSIRFPDRVPKGDHNKILKDHFFYGIRSDIHNSICHLYDDEAVTFSQLLVKAYQNEEEDNTSKLINKSVVAESTLEHRVDKLIGLMVDSIQTQLGFLRMITAIMGDPHSSNTKGLGGNSGQTPALLYMIFGKI